MSRAAILTGLMLWWCGALAAQPQRDFLSDHEIDQIRLAQEPNERLAQYLTFARLRLELIRQALAEEKPGRTKVLHDNLEDFRRIIEAVDTVIDDALARKVDLTKGIALAVEQEKGFLAALKEFSARKGKDYHLYQFAMQDALEATQDSLEESQHDLRLRTERSEERRVGKECRL